MLVLGSVRDKEAANRLTSYYKNQLVLEKHAVGFKNESCTRTHLSEMCLNLGGSSLAPFCQEILTFPTPNLSKHHLVQPLYQMILLLTLGGASSLGPEQPFLHQATMGES